MAERQLKVTIVGNADALKGVLDGIGDQLGPLGGKFDQLKEAVTNPMVAIPTLAVGAGVALFKMGSDFDSVYDGIQTTTGKTGKELDGLKDSFRNVVKNVPTDFESAGTALADLASKTGLTGKPLETLTTQALNLSRITGTDLKTNVDLAAKVMKDWNLPADGASRALDSLFKASQSSGVSFGTLSGQMDKFGPTLRAMGLDTDRSAALLAQLGSSGADADKIMGGLTRAVGKSGLSFDELVDKVSAGKTEADQMKIATDLLGKKVGLEFVDALKAGKINSEDMANSLKNAGGSINSTASDTADGHERMQIAFNRAKVALEPLATKMFEFAGQMTEKLAPVLENVATWISTKLVPALQDAAKWINEHIVPAVQTASMWLADHLGPIIQNIAKWFKNDFLPAAQEVGKFLGETLSGIIEVAQGVWERFGGAITQYVEGAFGIIKAAVTTLVGEFQGLITFVQGIFTGDWGKAWDGIKQAFSAIWDGMVEIVSNIATKILPALASIAGAVLGWIAGLVPDIATKLLEWTGKFLGFAAETLAKLPAELVKIHVALFEWIASVIPDLATKLLGWTGEFLKFAADTLAKIPAELAKIATAVLTWIAGAVDDIATALVKWTAEFLTMAANAATQLPGKLADVLTALTTWVASKIVDVATSIAKWTAELVDWVGDAVLKIPGKIGEFATSVTGALLGKVESIGSSVAGFATAVFSWVATAVANAPTKVGEFATSVINVLKGIPTAFATDAANMGKAIANSVISMLNAAISAVNSFKITIPSWTVQLPFPPHTSFTMGGFSIDFPNIPKIPMLAKGGTAIQEGWAMVGEEGPEQIYMPRGASVVPLPKPSDSAVSIIVNVAGNVIRERDLALSLRDELVRLKREGVTIGLA